MRKNFGVKTYVYPQPVFIIATYNEDGTANAMNAAWGGIAEENQIFLCLSAQHKTTNNILKTQAFTISLADAKHVVACDYVGIISGNQEKNKMEKAGFHTIKSEFVNAPIIEELPLTIECKLISYDPQTCRLFGEIINVSADEKVLDEKGKIDVEKLEPITYDAVHHTYIQLGKQVGKAFQEGLKLK